jgi:hypothetical protein
MLSLGGLKEEEEGQPVYGPLQHVDETCGHLPYPEANFWSAWGGMLKS